MLLTLCKHCGKFLKEGEVLFSVQIDEGNGFLSTKDVCQKCYESVSEPSLLCE